MRKCWCVLAGTSACDTCPNSREITTTGRYGEWTYVPACRVIEKYDTDGKLIERITEPVWSA